MYRDAKIEIYYDDCDNVYTAHFVDDKFSSIPDISFGRFQDDYIDDLKHLIDTKLDTIFEFSGQFEGAKLEWFNNGLNNRDIRLTYNTRVLKIFLIEEPKLLDRDLGFLITKSLDYLNQLKSIVKR